MKKIVNAAQWALDRLGLVQGSKSMRGLVICFGVSELIAIIKQSLYIIIVKLLLNVRAGVLGGNAPPTSTSRQETEGV